MPIELGFRGLRETLRTWSQTDLEGCPVPFSLRVEPATLIALQLAMWVGLIAIAAFAR
jgi:hypothetical protein